MAVRATAWQLRAWHALRQAVVGGVRLAAGGALAAGAALGHAQPAPAPEPADAGGALPAAVLFQPRAMAAGPWMLTPRLGLAGGYNDNVNFSPAGTATGKARVTSRYLTATPELTAVLPGEGIDKLEFNLRLEATRFASSPVNDTDNGEASLDGLKLLDPRTAVAWRATAQDSHDAVGATDLNQNAGEPDHFRAWALGAVLRHDSEDAETRTEVEATLSRKRYLNRRDVTRLGDADTRSLVVRRLWAGAADTGDPPEANGGSGQLQRWLAELRLQGADYPGYRGLFFRSDDPAVPPRPVMPLDNTDTRLVLGSLWEAADGASPFFTGSAKLGWQRKHSSTGRPLVQGVTWDLVAHLQPRASSGIDLASGRVASDAPGDFADAVWIRQQSASWTELWRPDLRSTLAWVRGSNGYRYGSAGLGATGRRDRTESLELGLRLDLRRDWQVGLNWSLARRQSSQAVFDYTRHLTSVMLAVAL